MSRREWYVSYHRIGDGPGCRLIWGGGRSGYHWYDDEAEARRDAVKLVGTHDGWSTIDHAEVVEIDAAGVEVKR